MQANYLSQALKEGRILADRDGENTVYYRVNYDGEIEHGWERKGLVHWEAQDVPTRVGSETFQVFITHISERWDQDSTTKSGRRWLLI